MAKITFHGLSEYITALERLNRNISEIEGQAIYESAKVVADAVRDGINGLKTAGRKPYERKRREEQKKGLQESFGISSLRNDNGFLNVKLGFDGYNSVETRKFPNGQPNAMIARVFNSGTSHNTKQPFFDKAIRATRQKALEKMKECLEQGIEQEMK